MEPVEKAATLIVDSFLSLIDTSKMLLPPDTTFEQQRQKWIDHVRNGNFNISDQKFLALVFFDDFYRKGEADLSAIESREPIPLSQFVFEMNKRNFENCNSQNKP